MSRRNNYWGASQYRGARRSGRGAVLAVLVVLAVLAVAAVVATWIFFPKTQSGPSVRSDPPAPSAPTEPAQIVVEPSEPAPTLPPAPESVRGIYISGPMAGSAYMDELIALVDETELNAVVIDIKDDEGRLTYEAGSGPAAEMGACVPYIQDMPGLVADLKDRGIYTIARVVAFKDPFLAKAEPDLALHDQNGAVIAESGAASWVNPFEKQAWDYLEEIALGAADAGFDEVQFDYVRFPAGGSAQIDYGQAGEAKKEDAIAGFLTEVTSLLHEKGVRCSADVFGTIITNPADAAYVGQDFVQLAQIVDKICPMVYPSHYAPDSFGLSVPDSQPYETIHTALKYASSSLFGFEAERVNCVRPWLQDFTATWVTGHITYGPEELRAQIKAVYDAGYTDWLLWNAGNQYTVEGLEPAQ